SRRRHTRFSRDWSSDVCSSDLFPLVQVRFKQHPAFKQTHLNAEVELIVPFPFQIRISHPGYTDPGYTLIVEDVRITSQPGDHTVIWYFGISGHPIAASEFDICYRRDGLHKALFG